MNLTFILICYEAESCKLIIFLLISQEPYREIFIIITLFIIIVIFQFTYDLINSLLVSLGLDYDKLSQN